MSDPSVTECLELIRGGDHAAIDRLLPLVYDQLRTLARAQLRREDTGSTLGATALVHEAYVRLSEREKMAPKDRSHFFAIAAQSMRRVLIDQARARKRQKRGLGAVPLPLEEVDAMLTVEAADELTALDEALTRLAKANPRAALVVERRFFGGLTLEETAETLGVSLKTVHRDWLLARAWLRKEIAYDGSSLESLDGAR
ncbi:MAG: sigma-70 family RNA polymerase sigma factor [Gemmatimonadaceae bacterium]|nr:sigma-70 family RNA polymerase sigma factor [Gemmatimonadaceae bacterium]